MKKQYALILLPLVVASLSSCDPNADPNYVAGEELKIISVEMNKEYGEAILIKFGNYEILVDSGNNTDATHVKEVLTTYVTDKTIDLLVVTHPHGDHIGGINNNCLNGFKVSKLVDFGYTYSPSGEGDSISSSHLYNTYASKRSALIADGTKYVAITDEIKNNPVITIDKENDLSLTWLKNDYYFKPGTVFPNSEYTLVTNPNSTSVAFLLTYKYWNIPFLGDADSTFEEFSITNNHPNILSQSWKKVLLKATHHASSSSLGSNFLKWAHPNAVFVSAAMLDSVAVPNEVGIGSKEGQQNHPNSSTVRRIKGALKEQNSTAFYWNGINGDLLMTTNGVDDFVFSGAGRHKDYYIKNTTDLASKEDEKNVTFFESQFYKYY